MATSKEGEAESRYAHLLQPCRDLAANWSVDVAQELEGYLSQLQLTPLFQDGQSSLNFAEAALLIQGSIQVYGKKVEYLYTLVLHALESITQRKQFQENGEPSTQGNSKDQDLEEEKEEEFLNLDDVPEEANIDLNDDDQTNTPAHVTKPPASLLVVEGDAFDMVKNGGELASYQIATSYLHRDFLLLDPCDADAVDNYLNISRADKGTPRPPSSSRPRAQRGSTPGRRASSAKKPQSPFVDSECYEAADAGYDDCDDPCNLDVPGDGNNNVHAEQPATSELDEEDPWAPLNPHEPGTLPVKPYKRGQLRGKLKNRGPFLPVTEMEFPLATRSGTTFPEFLEALQAKDATERLKKNIRSTLPSSPREHLRTDLEASDLPQQEHSDDDQDNLNKFNVDAGENEVPLPTSDADAVQNDPRPPESIENLCHAARESVMQKLAEVEVRAELAARVSKWKHKIEDSLAAQEARVPFDIHVYGERIIEKCLHEAPKAKEMGSSFAELVKGQASHDIARSFAALLQLVNNGNVAIEQTVSTGGLVGCFTAECSFNVKLLNNQKLHEKMLQYQAPSHAAKHPVNQVKRGKKHSVSPNASFTGPENVAPGNSPTPGGKKRRRRLPLRESNLNT